jgi:hypothetical protein
MGFLIRATENRNDQVDQCRTCGWCEASYLGGPRRARHDQCRAGCGQPGGLGANAALHEVIAVMPLLLIIGAVLVSALVWIALTSTEEGQQRDRRVERDYELRRIEAHRDRS